MAPKETMSHDEHGNCSKAYQIDNIEAMCHEMHKVLLVGNGEPAITVRLKQVETFVNACKYILGSILVAALLSGLGVAFVHLFKAT